MNRLLRGGRLRLTAAVTVLLVLAGGSGATAYWSGQAQMQAQARAASIGIDFQTLPALAPSPLAVTYTAQSRIAAGAVTIRNTGSRDAAGELLISAQSPTAAGLQAAITVAVGSVTNAAECTPQRSLTDPTVKTLSTTATSFPLTGALTAGATTTLCVQTTLQQSAASPSTAQSLELAIGAKLTYAQAAGWSTSSSTSLVLQSVAAVASAPILQDYARYLITNQGFCVERPGSSVARSAGCGWDSGWRVVSAGNGTFQILAANNSKGDRQGAQRWTAVQPGSQALQVSKPIEGAAQQWRITATGATGYRLESVSVPGNCAAIGGGLYNLNDTSLNPRRVVLAPCDPTSAAQRFAFEMVGTPLPASPLFTCAGGWGVTLTLEENSDYEAEVSYRAFLARDTSPERRTALGDLGTSGWDAVFRIAPNTPNLAAFVGADGPGNALVFVEQRIAQSEWMPIASAQVRATGNQSNPQISCGW